MSLPSSALQGPTQPEVPDGETTSIESGQTSNADSGRGSHEDAGFWPPNSGENGSHVQQNTGQYSL